MGHYAKVVNNVVENVITAHLDFIETLEDKELWIKTSYNTSGGIHYEPNSDVPSIDQSKSLRYNYAGIGYTYDPVKDAFIAPCPGPEYVLNEETCTWELKDA